MLGAFAAGGAVIGLARTYVTDLGAGDPGYGLLFGTVFCGLAAGMFLGPRLIPEFSRRRLFAGVDRCRPASRSRCSALIPNMVIAVLLTMVIGAFAGVGWVTGYTMLGLEVADELRGRTFAFVQTMVRVILVLVLAVTPRCWPPRSAVTRSSRHRRDGPHLQRRRHHVPDRRVAGGNHRPARLPAHGRPPRCSPRRRRDGGLPQRARGPATWRAARWLLHRDRGRRGGRQVHPGRAPSPTGCAARGTRWWSRSSPARPRSAASCARCCSTRATTSAADLTAGRGVALRCRPRRTRDLGHRSRVAARGCRAHRPIHGLLRGLPGLRTRPRGLRRGQAVALGDRRAAARPHRRARPARGQGPRTGGMPDRSSRSRSTSTSGCASATWSRPSRRARYLVVDGTLDPDEVAAAVRARLEPLLPLSQSGARRDRGGASARRGATANRGRGAGAPRGGRGRGQRAQAAAEAEERARREAIAAEERAAREAERRAAAEAKRAAAEEAAPAGPGGEGAPPGPAPSTSASGARPRPRPRRRPPRPRRPVVPWRRPRRGGSRPSARRADATTATTRSPTVTGRPVGRRTDDARSAHPHAQPQRRAVRHRRRRRDRPDAAGARLAGGPLTRRALPAAGSPAAVAPPVFDDVVGQEAVVAELARAVAAPRAATDPPAAAPGARANTGPTHAWLFTGPPGLGPVRRGAGVRRSAAVPQGGLRSVRLVPHGARGHPRRCRRRQHHVRSPSGSGTRASSSPARLASRRADGGRSCWSRTPTG